MEGLGAYSSFDMDRQQYGFENDLTPYNQRFAGHKPMMSSLLQTPNNLKYISQTPMMGLMNACS